MLILSQLSWGLLFFFYEMCALSFQNYYVSIHFLRQRDSLTLQTYSCSSDLKGRGGHCRI